MTTETKSEAEKIAEEVEHDIYAAFDAVDNEECTCFSDPEGSCPRCAAWEKARRITRDTITQALLDFREKDVRELVEGLEPFAEKLRAWEADWGGPTEFAVVKDRTETGIKLGHLRKAAALVRKFGEGKTV